MGSGAQPRQGTDDERATLCPHRRFTGAPCGGTVLPTGHCAVCGRAENGPRLPELPEDPREFGPAELLALPERVPRPAQERLIHPEAPLRVRMSCSSPECGITFAPPYTVGRVPVEGYCPACGEPYSYRPELAEGDVLRDQYRIMGPIAHGGQGWVYLAEDTHLGDVVAVKGMLNRYEQDGARLADVERRNLVAIRHPRIVQIRDFVARRDGTGQVTGGYIVMDDVGDGTLEKVVKETRRGESVLDIEHVAAYGCQILEAFVHLHAGGERAFVYGDMKPSNVVHHGDGVKVIDLGGMREQGQSQPPAHVTPDYMAPETASSPMPTTAHDLHTVGVTLRELAGWAVDEVPGLGTASFRGVVDRATRGDPGLRFADAREMAGQLRGALREIRALRGKSDPPEPSDYFWPSPQLLGARLGTVPGIEHWLDRPRRDRYEPPLAPALDLGAPTPTEIARRLPVPRRYPGDPQTTRFEVSSGYDPGRLLDQEDGKPPSVEIRLHNVRVLLGRNTRDDLERAQEELDTADSLPGPSAVRRWRLEWHRALVALRRADLDDDPRQVAEAQGHFTKVRLELPGEYAPKLALAYCGERLGERAAGPTAKVLYEAVFARNPAHGGAALGLARLALRAGDRRAALDVLGRVRPGTLDHTVARIASLRIRAARLPRDTAPLPEPTEVDKALAELRGLVRREPGAGGPSLSEDEALRLSTELHEWQLDALYSRDDRPGPREGGGGGRLDARGLRRLSAQERQLRERIESHYRQLAARHGGSAAAHEHLVDLLQAVRPQTVV
ncbi:tetratricopeptide repeat protein [Streptomyces europaeiscabiei]|uniref:tetratricopeptide repeat protein n=4 Tax=Streptomyces europaeiscabiei TaxID=146819 RepID=UPI0029B7F5EE|nr:tetratricopeptide repeat protein [Streptomyces europaeiscabiei]MDX2530406.1 tetratricopeptide repeat protein [Streptomyces europaeiscabiei]MDX3668369.1 tetratricopeptide repeat protein [Streptomyces europaeiscabiei]MDX3714681.1 tetratricopeptide repeat protein [Streptomyces europaeiscabiei]MDX3841015.1 tetratricopeptide repeat protein [Streptomyces europaeiscabiei]MDX3864265.1 tetratricopeptide repeat protein [Streptomyces europaeiscabiei]